MKNYLLKLSFLLWAVSFVYAQSPPLVNDINMNTIEDSTLNIVLIATDADNDSLGFAILDGPINGSLSTMITINDTAVSIIYTPNQDYFGSDSFSFSVTDNSGLSDTAEVSITVTAVDDAPTVSNALSDIVVDEDANDSTIVLTGVFSDVDNDDSAISKSVQSNTNQSLVTASIVGDTLTLDFLNNQNGSAIITIRGTSNGLTIDDTFEITVNQVNDVPVLAAIGNQTTNEDEDTTIVLSASDVDIATNDQSLLYSATSSNESLVTVSVSSGDSTGSGSITLDVQSNQNGDADITVTVIDNGTGTLTDIETFTLTVTAVNDVPIATITDTLITLIVSEGLEAIEFALNGSQSFDVDINNPNDSLLFQWREINNSQNVNINSPTADTTIVEASTGLYQFELKVSDLAGTFTLDTAEVRIGQPILNMDEYVFVKNDDNKTINITYIENEFAGVGYDSTYIIVKIPTAVQDVFQFSDQQDPLINEEGNGLVNYFESLSNDSMLFFIIQATTDDRYLAPGFSADF
jgi:hypothetical protein